MHDGGGGFGGGHMGGHMGGGHMGGGHMGGHPGTPAAHHHHGSHGSPDMGPVVPGYIPGDTRRRHGGLAAAGQRFAPGIAFLVFAVI
ncbi:MAG TPA: hypothetical protein VIC62_18550, partial [Nakamurella sp.]